MEGGRTTGDIASIFRLGVRRARAFSHPINLLKKVHVVMFEPSTFLLPLPIVQHEADKGARSDGSFYPTIRRTFDPGQNKTFV